MMSSRRERYFASVKSMAYSSDGARAAKVAARTHRHRPRCPFLLLNGAALGINTLRACLIPTSLYLWRADYYLIGKANHRP